MSARKSIQIWKSLYIVKPSNRFPSYHNIICYHNIIFISQRFPSYHNIKQGLEILEVNGTSLAQTSAT